MEKPYKFAKVDLSKIEELKELFLSVFTKEPWNDDWSDESQLNSYLEDLLGQNNSLAFGLYEDGKLIALSMGHTRHWYTGTEYFIDELCVRQDKQGIGVGSYFLSEIEKALRESGIVLVFLLTERDVPAFHFYQKNGFYELTNNVAFAKRLED